MAMWFQDRAQLVEQRKALGLSQAKLAVLAGMSRSAMCDVERGRVALRGERAQKLWTAICREKERQDEGNNALAIRYQAFQRGESLDVPGEQLLNWVAVARQFCAEVEELKVQLAEVPKLRDRLAEIATAVNDLQQKTQAATTAEGERILRENATEEIAR